jgi:ElaB/YqjD/DUF883 family membrane-anchored ribosome-binding protein
MTTPTPPEHPRTVAEIEADLARTRGELADTLDSLKERLNPKVRAGELAEQAKAQASTLAEQAKAQASTLAEQAKAITENASVQAKSFADDVVARKPRALAIVGVAIALVVVGVVAAARRRS